MSRPHPLPDGMRDRAFTVQQALASGVSAERLRRGDLAAPFHGLRVPGPLDLSLHERCLAYQVLRPDTFVSHLTAARLHGLPTPLHTGDHLDMAVLAPARAPRGRRIRGHRLHPDNTQIRSMRGLRVASGASVLLQLADTLTVRELVVLGDGLLRRRRPLATPELLARAIEAHGRRPGQRRLVDAARLIRPGTDSPRETVLRLDLIAAGLPEPEVNREIINEEGRFLATVELSYRDFRVIVEYDGDQHRTDRRQYEHDVDRLNDLAEAGWLVIRVNRSHYRRDPAAVIDQVRRALINRGWRASDHPVRPLPRSVA
ncbi:DUF559 domain-containing protein [Ruania alkalisoli]|uniref:DUF559 domain-containing protein n=1 Tax=Ruania alkalisoli TaxID=2779775 RepID=A0A7M1SVS5_9MICO|nr:DUF559 domain-containing protein [Ruania alkalisoli]QOR71669.1 DUF559 domain-containing protein [Ruania alkalisoli]